MFGVVKQFFRFGITPIDALHTPNPSPPPPCYILYTVNTYPCTSLHREGGEGGEGEPVTPVKTTLRVWSLYSYLVPGHNPSLGLHHWHRCCAELHSLLLFFLRTFLHTNLALFLPSNTFFFNCKKLAARLSAAFRIAFLHTSLLHLLCQLFLPG